MINPESLKMRTFDYSHWCELDDETADKIATYYKNHPHRKERDLANFEEVKDFLSDANRNDPRAMLEDYYTAFENFKRVKDSLTAANAGCIYSQYEIARRFEKGRKIDHVDKNDQLALAYYQLASKNGHAQASGQIGSAYEYGALGLKVDIYKAREYFKLALEQGEKSGDGGSLECYQRTHIKILEEQIGHKKDLSDNDGEGM